MVCEWIVRIHDMYMLASLDFIASPCYSVGTDFYEAQNCQKTPLSWAELFVA